MGPYIVQLGRGGPDAGYRNVGAVKNCNPALVGIECGMRDEDFDWSPGHCFGLVSALSPMNDIARRHVHPAIISCHVYSHRIFWPTVVWFRYSDPVIRTSLPCPIFTSSTAEPQKAIAQSNSISHIAKIETVPHRHCVGNIPPRQATFAISWSFRSGT